MFCILSFFFHIGCHLGSTTVISSSNYWVFHYSVVDRFIRSAQYNCLYINHIAFHFPCDLFIFFMYSTVAMILKWIWKCWIIHYIFRFFHHWFNQGLKLICYFIYRIQHKLLLNAYLTSIIMVPGQN